MRDVALHAEPRPEHAQRALQLLFNTPDDVLAHVQVIAADLENEVAARPRWLAATDFGPRERTQVCWPLLAEGHPIVIDDRILSIPYIDFRTAPDGIDGSRGAQISAGLTRETARQLAAILSAGPLPAPAQP